MPRFKMRSSFVPLVLSISILGCAKAAPPNPSPAAGAAAKTYAASQAAKGVWRIDEHGQVNTYLVLGESKAMLIDSGCGEPGLDATVAGLTSLPVIVVNTHGHSDHAQGNGQFKDIYARPADMQAVRAMSSPNNVLHELSIGQAFDLGGRKLSVIETPGHTRGSVCLLDAENRILFSGDNNNGHVWLFLGESLSVEEYLRSLEGLIAASDRFDLILPGHGGALGPSHLDRLAEACRAILKGTAQGVPYQGRADALSHGPNDALIAYSPRKILAHP